MLTGVSHIIIVGYSRVAAYPYGGVRGGCGVELGYLQRTHGESIARFALTRHDIQLTVGDGYLESIIGVVACEVDELEHVFGTHRSSVGVAQRDLDLIQTVWQVNIECVAEISAFELHRIAQRPRTCRADIRHIACLREAVAL